MCPLCAVPETGQEAECGTRRYARCPKCDLVFLDPAQRPTPAEEKAEYDLHENDPGDPRYRRWLSRLVDPMLEGVVTPITALDYGSGPGPTISVMLKERGHTARNYDPFFAPDRAALGETYDLIFCSETTEHFFHPSREFAVLFACLREGGKIGVMTQMLTPDIDFATWRYRLQPSHVAFYTPTTMEWIAEHYGATLDLRLPDVAVFAR